MPELNTHPYEIIGAPFKVWTAPVGTAFPSLDDDDPNSPWALVGTNGDLNYEDDGVTVQHPQGINKYRALGDSGSRKVFRTQEDLVIRLQLADLTLEQYAHALNGNSVTETPPDTGEVGYKTIGMSRGLTIATMALLIRGPSPYVADGYLQFEVPFACQTGSPEVVMRRDRPAALQLEWSALVDPDAASEATRFGRIRATNAAAGT